ncbi:hypothetical protein BsWGS_27124 [Bradybaena similaris]
MSTLPAYKHPRSSRNGSTSNFANIATVYKVTCEVVTYNLTLKMIVPSLNVVMICSLVAVVMLCSVVGYPSDNLKEEEYTEPFMDDNIRSGRSLSGADASPQLCGRKHVNVRRSFDENELVDDDVNWDDLDKVYHGTPVSRGDVPWHVYIHIDNHLRCGGVIISEYWVLTSVSCVDPKFTGPITFNDGGDYLATGYNQRRRYSAQKVILHPDYKSSAIDFNIALLKVSPTDGRGIRFNDYVQPICLPTDNETLSDGSPLTISGWTGHGHPILKRMTLPLANLEQCKSWFPYRSQRISDRILCLLREPGTTRSTYVDVYDHGGSAISSSDGVHIIHGIISSALKCNNECPATVALTNVVSYLPWIYSTIRDESDSGSTQNIFPPRTAS